MKPNFKAMAQQAFELQQQYGLTLNDKIAQEQLMPNLFRLFDAFTSLIREIYESEEEDNKEQLIQNAISDLSIGIASRLKLNAPGLTQLSLDPDDQNPDEDPDETPDEDEENMAELEELRSQVTELQQTQQLQEAYSALHARAGELVESGYLTPALYTSDFKAASFSAKDIVAKFGGQTLGAALATIQEKTIELNALEKFGKPVRMGTFVHEPLEQTNQADAEAEAFMSSYSIKTPLGQY